MRFRGEIRGQFNHSRRLSDSISLIRELEAKEAALAASAKRDMKDPIGQGLFAIYVERRDTWRRIATRDFGFASIATRWVT